MKIKRFNENIQNLDRRYKVDLNIIFKIWKRRKIIQAILSSVSKMIQWGDGTVYLYTITPDYKYAFIKSVKNSLTTQQIPVEALIDFDLEEYKMIKDAEKYNL